MTINPKPIITLLTDFGIGDSYVGQMKGKILSINPSATLVDITHSITPHDFRQAAFLIFSAWQAFPPGTIHLCVVDPGVGSDRRALLLNRDRHLFVGPDNGIFSFLLNRGEDAENPVSVYSIRHPQRAERTGSATFHGRDIFAPAAAQLSLGAAAASFGPKVDDCVRLQIPRPELHCADIKGEVIYVDGFGNLITNLTRTELGDYGSCRIRVGQSFQITGISRTYADVTLHSALAYWGSAGFLELGLREGNLARVFGLTVGCEITIIRER